MRIISHRGNINGPNSAQENSPEYINQALANGFDVEIDVWLTSNGLMLGHDNPIYPVDLNFLKNNQLWCHAKNLEALEIMLTNNIQCFWHQGDNCTLTSTGYIWTHSDCTDLGSKSIACWINGQGQPPVNCYGICTDYPLRVK